MTMPRGFGSERRSQYGLTDATFPGNDEERIWVLKIALHVVVHGPSCALP